MRRLNSKVCIFVFLTNLNFLVQVQTVGHENAWDADTFGHCLMEFKIPELLRLQHSLMKIEETESNLLSGKASKKAGVAGDEAKNCEGPKAMALVAEERGYAAPSNTDYHQPWQPEEKPSKLQTLFQISVTALAFLSFGGYLLCLIVQAIKSKGTTYFHPVATATTTNGNGGVKRIKIYRRSRRWMPAVNTDYSMTSAYSAHINYTADATASTGGIFYKSYQL